MKACELACICCLLEVGNAYCHRNASGTKCVDRMHLPWQNQTGMLYVVKSIDQTRNDFVADVAAFSVCNSQTVEVSNLRQNICG